ncbi:MAG TPA: peptide-methionine (R)-S-oxide reductase MsrB [Gammaproteobacteria bacterium]|nr:peptide-methionine (R)-S-oxide reductase MsrB [Gammaproteobacteria bacterium]
MADRIDKSDAEWKAQLTPEAYRVTRQKGTEPPFTGEYNHVEGEGVFHCVCCGEPLFDTTHKFDSGSGWPSFWAPRDEAAVETEGDDSLGMHRTEVHCRRCAAHLGHVFEDGPDPSGLRYCINSASLTFDKE